MSRTDEQRSQRPVVDTSKRPHDPLVAIVSIASQSIEVFGPDGSIHRSRVSTGQRGFETPTGVFSVLQRNRYHRSNIYSGAPMPYMQRLTWSGIALHEGHLPGFPASHGCIRMSGSFAQTMWALGRIGMRVIVSPRDVHPVAFNHAALPQPRLGAVGASAGPVRVASNTDTAAPADPMVAASPYLAAQARLAKATADKAAAEKAVKPAHDIAAEKSAESRQLAEALKASQAILADAEEHLEHESFGMSTVQTEAAEAEILARIRRAEAGVKAARDAHEQLRINERKVSDEAFAAAAAAREARQAVETAADELRLARRAVEPISVFVSRKTGRIHVRQGFGPLGDEPVTIVDPDRPIGTHVFTAIDQTGDGSGVRWVAVSVPTSGGETGKRKGERTSQEPAEASSAAEALGRITLPREITDLMAERLWPGASLIVSDYGLGETGQETDFVIVTR
ncbi:MAG: L,D-transpeptidase family protein [Hyphomicrobiaceae bacterium]|nr:L,D-transpeptidase family protein [Hyphomicrobiaceae bacterium]